MVIHFVIYLDVDIQDEIILFKYHPNRITIDSLIEAPIRSIPVTKVDRKKCELNGYFVCIFVSTLRKFENYRLLVFNYLSQVFQLKQSSYLRLRINMFYPNRHIIDYRWGEIINHLCHERRELDSALAWLSTLGGAFSSLGDHFESCAIMAGKISIQQFKLALQLGDPQIIARCRLFYALSLIQRDRLKTACNLVKTVYQDAVTIYVSDKRLKRMCQGIWTKLQYEWRMKYKSKKSRENATLTVLLKYNKR